MIHLKDRLGKHPYLCQLRGIKQEQNTFLQLMI